jgi:hypothetical protein
MRPIKRFLVFASEALVLMVGVVLSFAVAGYFDSGWTFYFGLFLTLVEFFRLRRRTRPWKIKYDAVGFEIGQAERRMHPSRARFKRIVGRTLLWLPSAIAVFVLFFFPVATHAFHPRSQYLTHYRIPIPWTFTVLPGPGLEWVCALFNDRDNGRFGLTHFWAAGELSSQMIFQSIDPRADTFEFNHKMNELHRGGAAQVLRRDFQLDDVALTCWQFLPRHNRVFDLWAARVHIWEISCETPVDEHRRDLYASFWGSENDMPAFYKIIEGVTPVK